jgi:3-methyladenine DNA glycosylase AlkD
MHYETILENLRSLANPESVAGMARFGIRPEVKVYGISMPTLRQMGKEIGRDHDLAERLWTSGIHEGRILATLVADPGRVTEAQMERWVLDFDSWDVCDQCCSNLFGRTALAQQKAVEWSGRDEEFVKRAGFVLMARLAVTEKKADDALFTPFLSIIERAAGDERNFVRKAVNWALRQIGKRNLHLNRLAIATAEAIALMDSKAARWIAADALRELQGEKVQARLRR